MAENFSEDFSRWLMGKAVTMTEIKPTELSLEPLRVDSLIFLESDDLILHIEFQTDIDETILFRMADYRLRLYRKFPQKEVEQVVIYLRKTNSEWARKDTFKLRKMTHQFTVIRLWEEATEKFLTSPGLYPFAVLSRTESSADVLKQVAGVIERIPNRREQSNVAATTAILAGLVLNQDFIQKVLRSNTMRESVMYQYIQAEEASKLVLRLLKRKIGTISPELQQNITQLSVEKLENLGEALLDFLSEADLKAWLKHNP